MLHNHATSRFGITLVLAFGLVLGCGTSKTESDRRGTSAGLATQPIPADARDGALPSEIAGFRFGISREQAANLCTARGLEARRYEREFPRVSKVSAMTCLGLPAPSPTGNFVQVETLFCEDRLCVVKLVAYDGAAFEPLRNSLIGLYGAVRADYSNIPKACEGAGLADCLRNGTAQRLLVWTRTDGFPRQITSMVRLVHTASAEGEYLFLFFTDRAGSELFDATANASP